MTAQGADAGSMRLATLDDVDEIARLIERSVLGLQAGDYSPEQMAGALGSVFGVDRQLIRDRSYFVADRVDSKPGKPVFNRIVTLRDSWGKPA